ncbi:hypothetical protein JXD38_12005 [candidate division WOR-3 bacterium]|nr:hypothetical protein [candidate division WOR-3 bacterium]
MTSKNASRTVWALIIAIVAAFFLFVAFAGQAPTPQPQDEFRSEQIPVST